MVCKDTALSTDEGFILYNKAFSSSILDNCTLVMSISPEDKIKLIKVTGVEERRIEQQLTSNIYLCGQSVLVGGSTEDVANCKLISFSVELNGPLDIQVISSNMKQYDRFVMEFQGMFLWTSFQ